MEPLERCKYRCPLLYCTPQEPYLALQVHIGHANGDASAWYNPSTVGARAHLMLWIRWPPMTPPDDARWKMLCLHSSLEFQRSPGHLDSSSLLVPVRLKLGIVRDLHASPKLRSSGIHCTCVLRTVRESDEHVHKITADSASPPTRLSLRCQVHQGQRATS